MATSPPLNDANIEHQISLQRYAQGRANTILPYLREVVDYLEVSLAKEGETITSKTKLNKLLADTEKKIDAILSGWEGETFAPMLADVLDNELAFQAAATEASVTGYAATVPAGSQAMSAAFAEPLLIGAKGGAVDFTKYTKDWKPNEIAKISSRISAGFYSGETTTEIARAVNGLKSQKYADGILNMTRANIQGMVKTSINHMSAQAKEQFNKANEDLIVGYRIVATLDSKTSQKCKYEDGNVYLHSDGKRQPKPPFHINCRSSTAPELSSDYDFLKGSMQRPSVTEGKAELVSGETTYYSWLKRQNKATVNEALGSKVGKVFRNAGLSPAEFKKASVNRLGQPVSLEYMANHNKKIADYLAKQNN